MDELLYKIAETCLRLDRLALSVYRELASVTGERELASFWSTMARQEEEHVGFWEKLLEAVADGEIPQIFQDPEKTLRELEEKYARADEVIRKKGFPLEPSAQFLLAFQLEFYLLHPSLGKLWHFYSIVRPGEKTPEEDYDEHLRQFTDAMKRFCVSSPEHKLLGESVMQMWRQIKELTQEAEMDVLTRVLNRRGLFKGMKILAHLAKRNAFTSGVLLIDIDHFKGINDRYGHQEGDRVLAETARIIAEQVRKSDVVGRYGGEEFLVFLPQVESAMIEPLAEKIRSSVEAGTLQHGATISVGAACTSYGEGVEKEIERLIRTADDCLYQAKAAGRNRVISRPC
jgi:diguanylate cyclase (GGDEF)-like protein